MADSRDSCFQGRATAALAVLVIATASTLAQETSPPPAASDPMARPTEYGIRLTPAMARGMSKIFTKEVLVSRYEMDEQKSEEAGEAIARRMMQLAHANEEQGQELFEFSLTELFAAQGDRHAGGGMGGIPPRFGMGFGKRVLPLLPTVRDFIRDVSKDVRPMLPIKQQLKMGADLMVVAKSMDAFEKYMQRWSQGDVDPFGDPFGDEDTEIAKNENGESKQFAEAKNRAAKSVEKSDWDEWKRYVEDAKKLYELDQSQCATADSILRESIDRAEAIRQDGSYRDRVYHNRLWFEMSPHLRMGWNNPLRDLIERDYEALCEPIKNLEQELKQRIDRIPTQTQRDAAEERILVGLVERGLDPNEE